MRRQNQDAIQLMTYRRGKEKHEPIDAIKLNDNFIIAIYPGRKSDADIIIRYRQKLKNGQWSRIRTPKHIHWTVDMLMKLSANKKLATRFIEKLEQIWKRVKPLTPTSRKKLSLKQLLAYDKETLNKFRRLSNYGEYNIKFLLLLARLLMLQEKTNYPEGRIFQGLLKQLREGADLFTILQTATYRGEEQ